MASPFVLLNNEFQKTDEPLFNHTNRAFAYGDALFETIHCYGTQPQFIENHWERLSLGLRTLKMQAPAEFSAEYIRKQIERLLNKNRYYKGVRVRLTVFRNSGGLYTPAQNSISWFMESTQLEADKFELNTRGLLMDIYDDIHKPINPLSNLKTTNALLYVLAGVFRTENQLDECFILNQYGRITETLSSNFFVVHGNILSTPPLSEGCIAGTLRKTIILIANLAGFEIKERAINEVNLLDAEEVFITNAIQGIRWVSAYKDRRYYNFAARKLIPLLNKQAFN